MYYNYHNAFRWLSIAALGRNETMLDSQKIHADWLRFFETVHTEDGWITPMLDAVNGVSAEVAAWKPAPEIASIWEIVNHATGWIEDLLADLTGSDGIDPVDWPPLNVIDESSWGVARERLHEGIRLLEQQVKGLSVEDIYDFPPRLRKGPRSGSTALMAPISGRLASATSVS